jgi:hypothetical protein
MWKKLGSQLSITTLQMIPRRGVPPAGKIRFEDGNDFENQEIQIEDPSKGSLFD